MLGQIRHGSCRARAILFKVLADIVGLHSKLLVVSFLCISMSEFFGLCPGLIEFFSHRSLELIISFSSIFGKSEGLLLFFHNFSGCT